MKTIEQLYLPILVTLLVTCFTAESCSQDQFMNKDNMCCKLCIDGFYVIKNCSKTAEGYALSTGCRPCSKCAEGWTVVSHCSKFSDAVCVEGPSLKNIPIFTTNSTANFTVSPTTNIPTIIHSSAGLHTVLYITLPLVLFLLVGIFACKKCVINRYAKTKKTPYHLQQL